MSQNKKKMLNDIIVNPKKDGRVEIPQSIVKIMGWEFHNKLYAYKNKDELILSFEKKSFGELLGTLKVSNKRIRVPSTFLKKTGLKNDISISCKLDSIILKIEYTNIDEIAKKIADKLNDSQAIALLNELKTLTGHGRYVFPSVQTPQRPMSNNTINTALRRLGYTKDQIIADFITQYEKHLHYLHLTQLEESSN